MKARFLSPLLVLFPIACASSQQPAPEPAPTPEPVTASQPDPEPEPEPSEEEKQRAEAAEKLAQDRAQMQGAAQVELRRLTPEIREAAKQLATKIYPNAKAGLKAALAGSHRVPGHAERDSQRHPIETLEFLGLKPTMTVLEYSPGQGWYTELIAPLLANQGQLLVTTTDPQGPVDQRSTYYAERFKLFLDKLPEAYSQVKPIIVDASAPDLKQEGTVDLALVFRGAHGWVTAGTLPVWLEQIHRSLKKNGVLGIEQHRAPADASPEESAKQGYLPEAWLIAQIEAHGFKLAGKSEINANPKDTKDYEVGVWALPPSLALGEKDRAKYVEIGESDRMTLKFVRVEKK